jgi:ATP-binding protein involved in chromosome partitioning
MAAPRQATLRLGPEFFGEAPLDFKIRETSNRGTSISVVEPDNPHGLVFRRMPARIWDKVAGPDAHGRAPQRIIIE